MAKIVNSWNDWDPLKRVILGLCDNAMIVPEEPATSEKVPVDSDMRGMWGLRPLRTVEAGNAALDRLRKAMEDRGVVVDRPTPLQWNQAIGTPDFRNDSMMCCMPPRDILLTMGNQIMASANSFRCRYFEYLAYWPLMEQYFEEDPEFVWTQAPRPRLTDRSYKHNYFDESISLEERLERTANKDFVTTEVEPMWDAADWMRMGKDCFVQHGLTTNRASMDWMQRYFPDIRFHAMNFPGDERHAAFCEDAFKYLDANDKMYDLIVLDPPAFAKHRAALRNALKGYTRLNVKGLQRIKPGGILFTFSCSQIVSKENFRNAVFTAAVQANRKVRILHQIHQPADHPINIYHPEGEYLKGLVLYVE